MELVTAIFLFAISTAISPGPNNIMIMSSGANYGVKRSLPMLAGICTGFPVMVMAIGLGLGSLFKIYPAILTVMNIVGIFYLLYLAYLIASATPLSIEEKKAKPITFMQAALFQWINPKAWMMATGAIAAYVTPQADPYKQVLLIALVFFITAIPSAGLWFIFGMSLKSFMANTRNQRVFNIVMAILLVLSLIPVIFTLRG